MKTCILLLSAILFTLPAQAQIKAISKAAVTPAKTADAVARQVACVERNARAFAVGLSNSVPKHILNQRLQFQREYQKAVNLYTNLQKPTFNPPAMREEIQQTIVNNTLKKSLLDKLDRGHISSMSQDLEQYFNLTPKLPIFSASASPSESFAYAAYGYLMSHAHKPSWQLREVIKFGGMRSLKLQMENAINANAPQATAIISSLNTPEAKHLFSLYDRAEELNTQIKAFIAQNPNPRQEDEDLLNTLRKMYDLYEELLAFAKNSYSVTNTVEIYKNLLEDMEKFVAEHHRAPLWQNPEERALHQLYEPLVFANQTNMFEEIIPILTKLYTISEAYPAGRLSERDALKAIQSFNAKHGFLPRSVKTRDFFDTRADEPLLFEAMTYWKRNSTAFAQEINKLLFPYEENLFPPFF